MLPWVKVTVIENNVLSSGLFTHLSCNPVLIYSFAFSFAQNVQQYCCTGYRRSSLVKLVTFLAFLTHEAAVETGWYLRTHVHAGFTKSKSMAVV